MGKTFADLESNPVMFPKKELDIPELGVSVRIKTMTGLERRRFENAEKIIDGVDESAAILISISVEDEDGCGPRVESVISWPMALQKKLVDEINSFNGHSSDSEEKLKKN